MNSLASLVVVGRRTNNTICKRKIYK